MSSLMSANLTVWRMTTAGLSNWARRFFKESKMFILKEGDVKVCTNLEIGAGGTQEEAMNIQKLPLCSDSDINHFFALELRIEQGYQSVTVVVPLEADVCCSHIKIFLF